MPGEPSLNVCIHRRLGAGSCAGSGAGRLLDALRREIATRGLQWQVQPSRCLGHCLLGPNVKAAPNGRLLHQCHDAASVVEQLCRSWSADAPE